MTTSILDCESGETAIASMATLLSTTPGELRKRFDAIDYAEFDSLSGTLGSDSQRQWLWKRVAGAREQPPIDEVHWFHVTRAPRTSDYSDGLLTLPHAAVRARRFLSEITGRPESDFRGGDAFHRKLANKSQHGPFGQLVKAFAVGDGSKFMRASELVEDLNGVCQAYLEATTPCIVKFRTRHPRHSDDADIAAIALYYCYEAACGELPCHLSNTNWGGCGVPVAAADVLRVEFLDDGAASRWFRGAS